MSRVCTWLVLFTFFSSVCSGSSGSLERVNFREKEVSLRCGVCHDKTERFLICEAGHETVGAECASAGFCTLEGCEKPLLIYTHSVQLPDNVTPEQVKGVAVAEAQKLRHLWDERESLNASLRTLTSLGGEHAETRSTLEQSVALLDQKLRVSYSANAKIGYSYETSGKSETTTIYNVGAHHTAGFFLVALTIVGAAWAGHEISKASFPIAYAFLVPAALAAYYVLYFFLLKGRFLFETNEKHVVPAQTRTYVEDFVDELGVRGNAIQDLVARIACPLALGSSKARGPKKVP